MYFTIFKKILIGSIALTILLLGILSIVNDNSKFLGSEEYLGNQNLLKQQNFISKQEVDQISSQLKNNGDSIELPQKLQIGAKKPTAINYDYSWLKSQVSSLQSQIISTYQSRVDAHINTDKVIYRPNDVIFIEVLFLESFNKTPIALSAKDTYFSYYYVTVDITDPSGTVLLSSSQQVQNSTVAVNFKVPQKAVGGEYSISVYSYSLARTTKIFRVRDYPRDELVITSLTSLDSYKPGQTIDGKINVQQANGEAFESDSLPTFEYSLDFSSPTQQLVEVRNQALSKDGSGYFSIEIPTDCDINILPIAFKSTRSIHY
ncbi:large extracellular alpha-helical protein [Stylonychia lemnae]|uniref:Large extracellular alpha-helical protein n=1 Tax=Stylonychia lemnae TaxID=5949 RepID=A0A077ZRI4_STYLE|nr:large extracellular alpha-helical protein [Stylonychia lemnae]|eukprot:CDW71945.1 large extracellular alpha-helical protein [Stylonychia lemnae]